MKSKERIQLTKWEWFHYFYIIFYLMSLAAVIGIPLYRYLIDGVDDISKDGFVFTFIYFLFLIFFYWWNWQKLFFTEFNLKASDKQLEKAVRITAVELGWEFYKKDGNFYEGSRYVSFGFLGQTRITIKRINDTVLINSIRYPKHRNGSSSKHNREDINSFLTNLRNICQGKDAKKIIKERYLEKEVAFWNESEWSIKMILMRIVGYGLTLLFIVIGMLLLFYEPQFHGRFTGLVFILISGVFGFNYIKNDLEVLREKSSRNKTSTKSNYKKSEKY